MLFVCSGNLCRSPMAAEYMRCLLARQGVSQVAVDSAGLLGIEGERAAPESIGLLRESGLDLSGHRSRGIRKSDLGTPGYIVVMTHEHREEFARRFPDHVARTVLIRAFDRGPEPGEGAADLEDPMGRPIAAFRECFQTIRHCVDHLVRHLAHRP